MGNGLIGFAACRKEYHNNISNNLLSAHTGVVNIADRSNKSSREIAEGIANLLGGANCKDSPSGQTAGTRFSNITRDFLNSSFALLQHIHKLISMGGENHLTEKQKQYLKTIRTLYEQQEKMYKTKTHTVDKRIVSIHQPWVRPIVRGKASAAVEFGAKISISMLDGYARIERLDWEAYNESATLIETVDRYFKQTGYYPKRVLADKIYRTRENLRYCEANGIRLNGPKLGRPPKDKGLYHQQCKLERSEAGERNAVEGKFGEGKRTYNLGRIKMRLQETSEAVIHLVFLVMNLEKRLRAFLRLFLESLYWGWLRPLRITL